MHYACVSKVATIIQGKSGELISQDVYKFMLQTLHSFETCQNLKKKMYVNKDRLQSYLKPNCFWIMKYKTFYLFIIVGVVYVFYQYKCKTWHIFSLSLV